MQKEQKPEQKTYRCAFNAAHLKQGNPDAFLPQLACRFKLDDT